MPTIHFSYPAWFILLCLLLGAGYALALYLREQHLPKETSKAIKLGIALARGICVSVIAFFLLEPVLKYFETTSEPPLLLVAHDNSTSIIREPSFDSAAYTQAFQNALSKLEESYKIETFSFGNELSNESLDYSAKSTNISKALESLNDQFVNQNIGGVLLATDGIYNEGMNPIFAQKLPAPIYAIALGDTLVKKDAKVQQVRYNQIVYLNDQFEILIDIAAQNCTGQSATLSLQHITTAGAKQLDKSTVLFQNNQMASSSSFTLTATDVGLQHYRASITPLKGEATYANNTYDFFVEVLDGRQKVVILPSAPHPDISALRQAIETNKNFEVTIALSAKAATLNLSEYDLAILHQLPAQQNDAKGLIKKIKAAKLPLLFVGGPQTNWTEWNEVQQLVNIKKQTKDFNNAQATFNPDFSLFTLEASTLNLAKNWPPLATPFGQYNLAPNGAVLFNQKIGNVSTTYPMMAFGQTLDSRVGVIAGTGLWQWRMANFQDKNNHSAFDEIISKSVQFLAQKADKRRFRVIQKKNIYSENEPIQLRAELYNASYELVNAPEVQLTLKNTNNQSFDFVFNRSQKSYYLDIGRFVPGTYTYKAICDYSGESHQYSGQFTIQALQLESVELSANHQVLYQLANETKGSVFSPQQLDALVDTIKQQEHIRPILHRIEQNKSLINLKWLFFALLGLLTIEWVTRKWLGAY